MKTKAIFSTSLSLLIVFSITIKSYGQVGKDLFSLDTTANLPENYKIGLIFNSLAFFKNNEYFHPLVEGYTLPGFQLQPRLYYQAGEKFLLEGGVHLSQFSGKKGLNSFEPLFRATYNATPNFSILLGWLKGAQYHQLIEPLFQWERVYTHPLEYGVQFLVKKEKISLDTWIDWEKYIEQNDPFQEELTFGTNANVQLFETGNLKTSVPVQATIKHKGGQVTTVADPLVTIANWATGFKTSFTYQSFLSKVNLELYYVGFADLSPQKKQAYKNGYGIYPIISADLKSFNFALGYWFGHQFIASKGEPLFLNASATNPTVVYYNRQVATFKTYFRKAVYRNISFAAYFESYYDIKIGQFDYTYGIHMAISEDILFVKK